MRRDLPPMNALVAFEAAARLGNFTRAAVELSVAQPAITRHIANIENWLGARLFVRNGSLIELTEEGKSLSMLSTAALDRLELGVRDIRQSGNDELVVGASFGIAHLWIMPRISGMRSASARNINLVTSDDYTTFDHSSVDFSIRFGNGEFGDNQADLLLEEKCQIIAAPAFLKNNAEFDPDNLALTISPESMFDHGDPNGIGWMDWKLWFEILEAEAPDLTRLTVVQSYPTMLDMVCAGEGISIGTIGIENDLLTSGKLTATGPVIGRQDYGYYLVYRKELAKDRSFEKLRSFLLGR